MDDVNLQEISEFVARTRAVQNAGGAPVLVLEDNGGGQRYASVERFLNAPTRARGTVIAGSVADFARLVGALDPLYSRRVYYTPKAALTCVLNDDVVANDTLTPGWRDWRITYTPKFDESWLAWMAMFGEVGAAKPRWCDQLSFAEFVQERAGDFVKPDGLTMLEIAQKFDVHRSGRFTQALRLDNGNISFAVSENNAPADGMTVPATLTLGMRVFEDGAEAYSFQALFRYRITEHKLAITVIIQDKAKIQKTAVADMVGQAQKLLDKTAFYKVDEFPVPTGAVQS